MKLLILIFCLFISAFSYSQNSNSNIIGNQNIYTNENGNLLQKTATFPIRYIKNETPVKVSTNNIYSPLNNTAFRWTFIDPVAIVNTCNVSGNGLYEATAWYLNSQRVSLSRINYEISKAGLVTLKIYDIVGREVSTLVNEVKNPGNYSVDFNAINLSSGVYFYKLESGTFRDVKKLILIK